MDLNPIKTSTSRTIRKRQSHRHLCSPSASPVVTVWGTSSPFNPDNVHATAHRDQSDLVRESIVRLGLRMAQSFIAGTLHKSSVICTMPCVLGE